MVIDKYATMPNHMHAIMKTGRREWSGGNGAAGAEPPPYLTNAAICGIIDAN